jgi:hypothetical protein
MRSLFHWFYSWEGCWKDSCIHGDLRYGDFMIRLFEKAWRCGVCILGLHVCLFLDRRLVIEEKKVLDEGPGWILGFMMAALFLGTMYLDALVILPLPISDRSRQCETVAPETVPPIRSQSCCPQRERYCPRRCQSYYARRCQPYYSRPYWARQR